MTAGHCGRLAAAEDDAVALAAIADELARLRVLKEYELGVLSGTDHDGYHVALGDGFPNSPGSAGMVVYDESKGSYPDGKEI